MVLNPKKAATYDGLPAVVYWTMRVTNEVITCCLPLVTALAKSSICFQRRPLFAEATYNTVVAATGDRI